MLKNHTTGDSVQHNITTRGPDKAPACDEFPMWAGSSLCLRMPAVCTYVARCGWLHAGVCVSLFARDCVCDVSCSLIVWIPWSWQLAQLRYLFFCFFPAFGSLWKQPNWATAADTIAKRYLSPWVMVSPWISNLCRTNLFKPSWKCEWFCFQ